MFGSESYATFSLPSSNLPNKVRSCGRSLTVFGRHLLDPRHALHVTDTALLHRADLTQCFTIISRTVKIVHRFYCYLPRHGYVFCLLVYTQDNSLSARNGFGCNFMECWAWPKQK